MEGQQKARSQELIAIDAAKPKEVTKPNEQDSEQKALASEIDAKMALLQSLGGRINNCVDAITKLKSNLQHIVSLQERLMALKSSAEQTIAEVAPQLQAIGIDPAAIVGLTVNLDPVEAKGKTIKAELAILETGSEFDLSKETEASCLKALPDLRRVHVYVGETIEALKERLGTPQRQYQNYLERLANWQKRRDEIEGSAIEPKPDSLRGIEAKLRYLDEELAALLSKAHDARIAIVGEIFDAKRKVLRFYGDLKQSVEARLAAVRAEGFWIEIDASFVVDSDFRRKFLELINRRRKGVFREALDADAELNERIGETDWNDMSEVQAFARGLLDKMRSHNGGPMNISDQVRDVKEFYDFLFSLDYIDTRYELRLSGKNLNELSPGEKGLLLLVFYLQLDRKNTPLVIDQPEDNLDNDSIFQVLATCIREAKKTRQVVLVTHNPNLAVGADAEQVIYVKLDKTQNYQFSWETGAIENPTINRRIVDILEGSQPAFVKRRLKYGIA